ncbi:hypothetical protein GW915_00610 [bacterium]|nr:hypothetical protein [bacterium]
MLPFIKGSVIELGSGDNADVLFFQEHGLTAVGIDAIQGDSVEDWIRKYKSPEYVYTRFFWHSIDRPLQLEILDWVKDWLFIEARTTEDILKVKTYNDHKRYYVDTAQLVDDLKSRHYQIIFLREGTGLSPYNEEDPHLVRVIAKRN